MTDNKIPLFSEELAKASQQAEQATQDASATPLPSDIETPDESAPYNYTPQPSVASVGASDGEKSDIVVPMRPNGEEPGDATSPIVETTQATQPNDTKPKESTPKAKPVKYPIAYNDEDLQKAYGLLTDDERKGINLDTDAGRASMSAMVDRLKLPNRLVVGADGKQQRIYLPYDPDDTSSEAYTHSQKPIEVIGTEGKRGGTKLGIPLAEIMDNPSSVRWQFGDTTITGMQPITGGVTQAKVKDLESASYTSDGKPILTFKTQDGQTQKVILNATKADVDKARSERNAVAEVDLRSKEALLQARQSDIDAKLSKAMHDEGYTTPDVTQGVDEGNSLSSLVRLYLLPRINPKTAPLANAYDTNKATLDKIQAIKTNITNGNTSSGTIDDIVKSGSEVLGGFLSKVSKASTWDNGVSELSLATYGKKAYDKYMAGGKLTDDEQAMLDAIGYSLYFDEAYKDNLHNANLGAGVAESLPYAINIAIAGWTGAGKAVGNAVETSITKALKSRLLKRYGERAIARWLPQIASKATSAMTEAGVATGVGGLKQEADALSRMTGDVDTSTIDASGHATYNKDSKVDGRGVAHYKAFGAGLIENLSEMAEPYIAMIPRGVKSVVSNKMASLAKKSGTFNTLYDAMASLKPSQLSQVLDAGLRKGKINGLFEEVAGEVAGNIANAALIGDMSFTLDKESPEWQNSVFNPDVNADIVAQCAIMSYGFRVPGAIADATYNASKAASSVRTNIMGKKAFGDKWMDVKATIDAMSPEDAVEFASNAVKDQSDGCEAVYRYAIQSKGEQLANNVQANKDDNANDITDVAHETAVKAVDAPIEEARQAVMVARESSQELPNALKVSIDALVDNDASDGEVKSLFDQLSDAERPMAEQYYLAQVQLKGHEVGATARADAETEQFADAVSDMSTEVDGNAVVMTAEVDGEQKVIKSKGDTMTILADGTAVTSDKVTDVKTSNVEDIVEMHRSQALQSEMDKLDFAKSHNPNTINPNSGDVVMGADGNQYVYNEATTTNSDGSQVTQTCLYPAIPSDDGGIVADTKQPLLQGITKDEVLAMQDRYYDGLDNNATQGTTRNEEATDATDTQETTDSVEDNTTDAETNVNDATSNDGQQTEESVETPNEEQSIDQGIDQAEVSTEQENTQPKDVNVTDASKIADTYVSKISKARASKSDSVRRNADKLVSAFAKKAKASSTTDLGAMVARLASQTDNDTAMELLDIANKELQGRKSARKGKANVAPQSDNDVQTTEATQTNEATESPITEEANSHLAESEQKAKERMKYLTPSQVARLMRIGKVAKSMGLGIRFVDSMADNGLYDPNTNTITIALDAENPIEVVFGHEVTHGLRNQSEEAYQSLRNAVIATIPSDAFKARVASTKRIYEDAEQKGYDDEYYEEEAICDLVGELVGKSDILSNLKRNADYKVLGWMHSVAKSIMGVLRRGDNEYQKFSEAEKAFRQAYLDAVNRESYMDAGGYFEDDMSKVPIRSSVRSITTGIGLKPVKDDGNGNFVLEGNDGKKFDSEHPVTAEYLDKISQYDANRQCSPMAYLIHDALTEGHIDKSDLPSVFKTYADILNLYLNIGKNEYGGFDNLSDTFLWLGDSVYKTVATNSDTQYKLSLDITRVCKKNEAVIRAISEMQRREGYGITPGQILEIYEASNRAGYQVPCPVCYVFTRYIRNGQFATIMINGQRKYGHLLKNPDTMTEGEKTEAIEFWKKELAKVEAENASNKNAIKSAKEDIVTIQTEINNLAKIITDPANHNASEISKAKKKVTELDKRYRAALDVVSQSSLDSWIRIFAVNEHNGKFSLVTDSYNGFPEEVALDLRLTSLAKREYPAIQRFRNSRGSGAGKEITFESDNAIGDVALGLSSKGHAESLAEAGKFTEEEIEQLKKEFGEDYEKMLGRKNYYLLASECSDSKLRRKILNDASKAFGKARVYLEQQTLRGGQRMWSWSDNIESLSPDVVINLMQLQMLGGGLQTYSKQLEGIAMVASLGGYVNGSLMGKGNGVREVQEEDTYQLNGNEYLIGGDYTTTDAQGNETILRTLVYKDNNGKRFVLEFDNVVGVEPFGHGGKKGLFDLNATMDKAGNILVGMNDTHIRTAMADDRIFFIIPWHSSGANNHVLSQMYRILQVKYAREESTDYTKMQDDKFVDEGGKYPKGLADYFESHKRDDIPCAFGNIESSSEDGESLSESQIKYRRLREYALLGYPTEGNGGNAVRVDVSNYPELMEEINKDYFLNKVYNTVQERVSTQSMIPDDITHIYPYEYWLTDSTLDNADENTAYYIEYCRRLGVKPKFCGSLPGTGHGNFLDNKGAWKLLIDRRMYDTNGNYQDIDSVSVKGFSTDLIDPRETAKKYDITKVADKSATGEIVSSVMEKEKSILGKNLSVNYDTNLNDAVAIYNQVKSSSTEPNNKNVRKSVRKDIASETIEETDNDTHTRKSIRQSAEEAASAYKEEAERPKPLVSAILHSIRGGKRNVPIDPFVEGWDSIISRDAFKLEETSFDSLKAVEEFQRYMTGSKDVPDYLNAHRALMVLSSVNKAQMDMFEGTYVENLRKAIEEMVGTAEMNKGFYAEDGALAELDRFLKAQHGLERNRDMRVRAKLSEIYNEKIAEAQVAYNQTQDKEAYNDAVKQAKEEYNVALEEFYAKRDEIVAEGLEAGDNWYLINTQLDDYVIKTFFKSDKNDARDLTLAEINALKAKRDELLERAKNEQWSARRLQEALNKMLSEESFKSITGNKKMVSLPATEEYYDELAGLTGMFNWGNTPLGVYLANEEAKQFVSWYKGTENKESLDAVEKAIADINDFSLKKQKESGLVDEDYVKEQKRRYLNFVPLRDFMDVSSDDMYDYLTGNAGVGGNPVKTAKGRHSEAGPAIAGLINVANRSITAGNRNLALQKMYNIVKAKGVNTLANARNRWIVRDSEDTNKWHDAEPEFATDATAEQVTTKLEEFEKNMKALEEQGLARRVDGKRSASEYRIMSRTQMDEHKIKVAIGGRQYIIDFLGNPRAAQAANGMTNPDVSDDAGRTLFRTFKNFLASAFTSKNIAFSVANFFRDTEHSNNYVFIKEGGEYYRRFTDRQFNKFKYRSYMKEIYSKLKMFREGKLSEDDTFYQFMNGGGATGYTFVQSQEEEAEKFVKELVEAKKGNWGKKMWNRFFDMVEYMGNVSELTNRYIAFLTSREMGRSIGRSIEDAKEVTLNFNRKGSGTKTKIDGLLPKYLPSVVEYGQRYILFFNANVQAKRQLLYMMQENPAKTTGARIGRATFYRMMIPAIFAGVFLPAINDIVLPAIYSALGFDDDDDEGKYDYFNKLGDYERSHSINFALPNNAFLSIPVSPDIAPFMSIGDIISAQMQNKRDMSLKDFIEAGTDIISPININYGSEDDINWTASAMSFFPSQMRPIGDVFVNTNFMGQPVYKGGGIGNRQYTPEYKKGMRRTSPALTAWSKFVNDMSGGDEVEKGAMDGLFNNPAVMEHLLKGYLGGYGTATLDMVINPLYNSLTGDFKDLSLKAEQLPLVGRFYKGGSRDEQMRRMERTFRNEVYERNAETRAQESELKKEAMKANREGQLYRLAELRNKYIQLVQSDKYKKYYATKQASEAISDQLKLTSTMTDNEKRYLIDMMKRTIGIYRGEIKIYGTPSEDNQ